MAMTGMDIAGVRNLAAQMDSQAGAIEGIIGQLTSALGGTDWQGPDRARFEGEWTGSHVPALRTVVEALRAVSVTATANANEQEGASA